jgi:hypothetical protein
MTPNATPGDTAVCSAVSDVSLNPGVDGAPARPPVCGDHGGRRNDGKPCGANLSPDAPPGALCPHHDPLMADEMERRRAKGRAARSRLAITAKAATTRAVPPKPDTLEDNAVYTAWVLDETAKGTLDARTSHELFVGLRQHQSVVEKRDLQREIASLRRELAEARSEQPKPTLELRRRG